MPDMEESAQPKPADPSDPELHNGAGDPDEPEPTEEEELLGNAAETAAGRSNFADGNGAGSATPEPCDCDLRPATVRRWSARVRRRGGRDGAAQGRGSQWMLFFWQSL